MTLFGAGELTHWPELLPALINMLDSDNFSVCEVGLGLLFALVTVELSISLLYGDYLQPVSSE